MRTSTAALVSFLAGALALTCEPEGGGRAMRAAGDALRDAGAALMDAGSALAQTATPPRQVSLRWESREIPCSCPSPQDPQFNVIPCAESNDRAWEAYRWPGLDPSKVRFASAFKCIDGSCAAMPLQLPMGFSTEPGAAILGPEQYRTICGPYAPEDPVTITIGIETP